MAAQPLPRSVDDLREPQTPLTTVARHQLGDRTSTVVNSLAPFSGYGPAKPGEWMLRPAVVVVQLPMESQWPLPREQKVLQFPAAVRRNEFVQAGRFATQADALAHARLIAAEPQETLINALTVHVDTGLVDAAQVTIAASLCMRHISGAVAVAAATQIDPEDSSTSIILTVRTRASVDAVFDSEEALHAALQRDIPLRTRERLAIAYVFE